LGRYLRFRDLLNITAAIITAALAVNSYSTKPTLSIFLGIFYVLVVIALLIIGIRNRVARDFFHAQVLWGLFSLINDEIYAGDERTRFTLFQRSPLKPRYIVPTYRFYRGGSDPISEADQSRARFKYGEGITGEAWQRAGQDLLFMALPKFATRQEFEGYYIDSLSIQREVVGDLSRFMEETESIFCYGFLSPRDSLLGVLSIDLQAPVILASPEERIAGFVTSNGEPVFFDWERMKDLLKVVQNVLESLQDARRGNLLG
jgi:hypothetical protein